MKGRRFWGGIACLCMLLSLLGGTPVTAETTEEDLFRSHPSSAMFDSLWVGDIVVFELHRYDSVDGTGGPSSGNSLTVISGNGVETVSVYGGSSGSGGMCTYHKGLKFTKPGKASVQVAVADPYTGTSAAKTFSFTVINRPSDKPVTVTHDFPAAIRLKVGDSTRELESVVRFDNLNYGVGPDRLNDTGGGISVTGTACTIMWGALGGATVDFVNDQRSYEEAGYVDLGHGTVSHHFASRPGTITFQPVYRSQNIGGPICTMTVEEPVITTNAPASIKVDSTLRLETALTNTALQNHKTSEYADGDIEKLYQNGWGDLNPVAYIPTVPILEGSDCVTQSNRDYSNTLSTSETLTFKKAGMVKLKVAYTQIDIGGMFLPVYQEYAPYNPEKIITMQVTDGSGTTAPVTGGSTTGSVPSANPPSSAGSSAGGSTTGNSAGMSQGTAPGASSPATDPSETGTGSVPAPSLPPIEERPVVLTDGETGIQIGAEEGVLPPDTALVVKPSDFVLTDAAGQFTAFDISLESGGARIQPDGRVQVSIPIPAGYDRERLAVYHIAEDGTRTELPSAVVGEAITFETAHFSLYVVAEKAAAQAAGDTSLPGGKPAEKGGSPVIWIILCVVLAAAAGGGFALWYVKFHKKE